MNHCNNNHSRTSTINNKVHKNRQHSSSNNNIDLNHLNKSNNNNCSNIEQRQPQQRRVSTGSVQDYLSCHIFNCGTGNMQRASVSRRSEHNTTTATTTSSSSMTSIMSPGIRSRSSERHISIDGTDIEDTIGTGTGAGDMTTGSTNHKPIGIHRAMSDPFDTPTDDNVTNDVMTTATTTTTTTDDDDEDDDALNALTNATKNQLHVTSLPPPTIKVVCIPTLPRFPCTETHNKNCWNVSPISLYHVRGLHYNTDQKKIPSISYLLQPRGVDIILTDNKKSFTINDMTTSILGGQLLKQPTLAINFRFPWGYMNLYFEVPSNLVVYMNDDTSRQMNQQQNTLPKIDPSLNVGEQTLAKWLLGDTQYKNERLKLIPYVAEGPWVVRNMVTGRPAIIGKKLPVSYQYIPSPSSDVTNRCNNNNPVLLVTLDIGNSSATAKRIVSVCRRYMNLLTVDIGFVIQGDTIDELPEQMLGAIRIHGPDPLKAPKLN